MSLALKMLTSSSIAANTSNYVDDVFSAFTYTGTAAAQDFNMSIDLLGKGGMVWTKNRDIVFSNKIFDTARGPSFLLSSDLQDAQSGLTSVEFTSTGWKTTGYNPHVNRTEKHVAWAFRKARKFFDIVTYVGNGVAGKQIPHALGDLPGMIIVKSVDVAGHWAVYHRSLGETKYVLLSTTQAENTLLGIWNNTAPTASAFTIGDNISINTSGATYVAYLFAHDPSADGIIQCGSFTGNGSDFNVTLGWEPQYVLMKLASSASGWIVLDAARGFTVGGTDNRLFPNDSSAETTGNDDAEPTATGFTVKNSSFKANGAVVVYMAIRRPNKVPTSGTQVYKSVALTGTGAARSVTGVGFAPDLLIGKLRSISANNIWADRLRGPTKYLASTSISSESLNATVVPSLDSDGFSLGNSAVLNASTQPQIIHLFKRAPGFMDQITFDGNEQLRTVAHKLGVVPELMIFKSRNQNTQWGVYHKDVGIYKALWLTSTSAAFDDSGSWGPAAQTATHISVGQSAQSNTLNGLITAYLFASLAGISKVFSYTGNGASKVIPCGFSNGTRFVLIKRTDDIGNWMVWDSVRGITAGIDPISFFGVSSAENTTLDTIDPDPSGFIVNQDAANINVNGGTYIGLAIA